MVSNIHETLKLRFWLVTGILVCSRRAECLGVVYLRTLLNKQMWMAHIQQFCQPFVNMSWNLWDHDEIMCATKGATLIDDLYSISRDRTVAEVVFFTIWSGHVCHHYCGLLGTFPAVYRFWTLQDGFYKLAIDSKTWASRQNISQFPKGTPHWNQVDGLQLVVFFYLMNVVGIFVYT